LGAGVANGSGKGGIYPPPLPYAALNFLRALLRWGRLWEVATNFILAKAKFAVACGRFDENFNAG
jgi:hypothetical protein